MDCDVDRARIAARCGAFFETSIVGVLLEDMNSVSEVSRLYYD